MDRFGRSRWVCFSVLFSLRWLLAAKYDYEEIGKGRLTNYALMAISAGRLGITVISANARDFSKLREFRAFEWRVNNPGTS